MLSSDQAQRIKRLYQSGVSYRRIASKTGHSTFTIYNVLAGRWCPKRTAAIRRKPRCPGCGAKVMLDECLACRLRDNRISRAA